MSVSLVTAGVIGYFFIFAETGESLSPLASDIENVSKESTVKPDLPPSGTVSVMTANTVTLVVDTDNTEFYSVEDTALQTDVDGGEVNIGPIRDADDMLYRVGDGNEVNQGQVLDVDL